MTRRTAKLLRRIPATLVFAVLLVFAAVETGSIVAQPVSFWAVGVPTTLQGGAWWTVFSALIVPADAGRLIIGLAVGVPLLGVAEHRSGPGRLAPAFLLTGVLAATAGVLLQWFDARSGAWFTDPERLRLTVDPLTPVAGAFLCATADFGGLWRRRARLLAFGVIGMLLLNDGDAANLDRLIAALMGLALGVALHRRSLPRRPQPRRPQPRSCASAGERRRLLAALVSLSASGPLIALASPEPIGPSAELTRMLALPDPTVLDRCAGVLSAVCRHDLSVGPGPVLLAFVPSVLLGVAAVGLAQGRRLALVLAFGVQLATAVLGFAALDAVSSLDRLSRPGFYGLWAAAAVLVPTLVAVVLLSQRGLFRVVAPRAAALRWALVVLGTLLTLGGAFAALNGAGPLDVLRRLLPATMLAEPIPAPRELLLYTWLGPAFWAVVVLAVLRVSRASDRDAARRRTAVRDAGGGSFGYRGLAPGAQLWPGVDGGEVVFRVRDGVALVFGLPADPQGFASYCGSRGWIPAFVGVPADALTALGGTRTVVAREYVVTLPVRPSRLDGAVPPRMRTLWTRWEGLTLLERAQVDAMVQECAAPELGLVFGGDDSDRDPDAAMLILFDDDDHPVLVATWWPIRRGPRTVGWSLERVRRAPSAPAGSAEAALAAAAERLRSDGAELLILLGPPPPETPLGRLLDAGYRGLEPAAGLRDLLQAGDAAGARTAPLDLVCPDPTALGRVAAALVADADARSLRIAALLPAGGESANGRPA